MKDSFENILISSKRKPDLVETDQDRGFYSDIFQIFLKTIILKSILEVAHLVVSWRKDLTVLLDIFSKKLFLKQERVIGLNFYSQKQNNMIKDFNHLLN